MNSSNYESQLKHMSPIGGEPADKAMTQDATRYAI